MMKTFTQTKRISSSLLLATLLLTGCGSGAKTSQPTTQEAKVIQLEKDKKEKLLDILKTRGATYQSSSYSKDKNEILIVALEKNKTIFYRYDATSLELLGTFEFEVDGIVGVKSADADGKYTIISSKDKDATDYTYDSKKNQITKEKEYTLPSPKKLIQEQRKNNDIVKSFTYTPTKLHGLVITVSKEFADASHTMPKKTTLSLYSMDNPSSPFPEKTLYSSDDSGKETISNIQFLGTSDPTKRGLISFDILYSDKPNQLTRYTKNYFTGQETIPAQYLGIANVDEAKLARLISQDQGNKTVSKLIVTPTKLGAIALIKDIKEESLYLYGLEDLDHPKKGSKIITSNLDEASISDIQVISNGIMIYTMKKPMSNKATKVTYNYFEHKIISSILTDDAHFKEVKASADALLKTNPHKTGEDITYHCAGSVINVLTQITPDLYAINYQACDTITSNYTGVYSLSQHKFLKTLAYTDAEGLTQGKFTYIKKISPLKNDGLLNYATNILCKKEDGSGDYDGDDCQYHFVTGVATHSYDAKTNTITDAPLPVKIHYISGIMSHVVPFYSPDKQAIFTIEREAHKDRIKHYDANGTFIDTLYTQQLENTPYTSASILSKSITFTAQGYLQFEEKSEAYHSADVNQSAQKQTVVFDYLHKNIISTQK
jgi:hypothetical protein